MKIFQKIQMASEDVKSLLKTGVFYANGEVAATHDGALVHVGDPVEHDLYSSMKDLNARNCTAYDADAPIFGFVDYVGVSHADVLGVNYRIGDKIAGVYPSAGEGTRIRIPCLGDEFYLGNENFNGTPVVGQFAVPEAGKTTMKVSVSKAEGFCIAIEDERDLIMGQVNEGSKLYRCRVISL